MGTPDAFGGAANSTSDLRLTDGDPPGRADPGHLIDIALNDVRCVPTGARCGTANDSGPADYSGEMRFSFTFRLTDHWNGAARAGERSRHGPGLHGGFPVRLFLGVCGGGSTSIGSTCNLTPA